MGERLRLGENPINDSRALPVPLHSGYHLRTPNPS